MKRPALLVPILAVTLLIGGYFAGHIRGQSAIVTGHSDSLVQVLRVEYVPHPRDIVNLVEGTPYTVPAKKVLVIRDFAISEVPPTTLGDTATQLGVTVNGVAVWESGGGFFRSLNFKHVSQSYSSESAHAKGQDVPLGPLSIGVSPHYS